MKLRPMNRFLPAALAVCLAPIAGACGDEGGIDGRGVDLAWGPGSNKLFVPPSSTTTGNPMEGDWFGCENAECTMLDGDGLRFAGDGRTIVLDSRGDLDPGETYCEQTQEGIGKWTFDGTRLVITDPMGRKLSVKVTFSGANNQRALLTQENGQALALIARVDPPRSTGVCRDTNIPIPEVGSGSDAPPPRGG